MKDEQRTNRLIEETSPYLKQHAHNPVNWYPWGSEAIERARREDKPIFLSVGFSACHWCQVMERESFRNDRIARILNTRYITVKVDREERPDIDQHFQVALEVLRRGAGGWPTNLFLTPQLQPYYAGTYFPPEDRGELPGFERVLKTMADHWDHNRENVMTKANQTTEALRSRLQLPAAEGTIGPELIDEYMDKFVRGHDRKHGGFGGAPKFPPAQHLSLALRTHLRTGNPALLEVVTHTLDHMADGGIYDHLGGGFHRYSTDVRWLIPHFEKMLYDNALLAHVYTDAYLVTGRERYREIAAGCLDFVIRDMRAPDGGFCSTVHADTRGREGAFFLWTHDEIRSAIGSRDALIFAEYYGVTEAGNFDGGRSVLHIAGSIEDAAMRARMTCSELEELLAAGRAKLYEVRSRRVPPPRDDKVIVSWNGLMIGALARGGRVFDEERYLRAASAAAQTIREQLLHDGRLRRTYRLGRARFNGFLEDYAFLANGLIELYEATFDISWLTWANELVLSIYEIFADPQSGGLFSTSFDHEKLLARSRERQDSAMPAGASQAALASLRVGRLTGSDELRDRALALINSYAGRLREKPTALATLLAALEFELAEPMDIAVVGISRDPNAQIMRRLVNGRYLPNAVIAGTELNGDAGAMPGIADAVRIPFLEGKEAIEGRPTVYICRNRSCAEPVTDPAGLATALGVNSPA